MIVVIILSVLWVIFAVLFLDLAHPVHWYPWHLYPDSFQARAHDAIIRWWERLRRR